MAKDPVLLIGAGRMGGALLKGWLAKGLTPVIAVEPKPSADLLRLARRARVLIVPSISAVKVKRVRACVIALKPQILKTEATRLKAIANGGTLMLSIAAGTTIAFLKQACGARAKVVRAMPNTPGSIGKGITAIFAPAGIATAQKTLAESLLAALGATVWVKRETQIDTVTAVSGSGPAYVFLLVEALADAAEAEGLPRKVAEQLARATITGAGALLDADSAAEPALLRQNVTSPGGTTEAALRVLMADDGLQLLIRRAVSAANRRAEELGRLS